MSSSLSYLKESLKNGKDGDLCRGWDYLKNNITAELKEILLSDTHFWSLEYLDKMRDYLLNHFLTTEEINNIEPDKVIDHSAVGVLSQLKSFVYVWNDIKRDCAKEEKELNLKADLEKQGFKEINPLEEDKLKSYDGLKVLCVLDVNAIGLLGSFDKKTAKEGKLVYSEYNKALILIPKRCRTRGHIIRNKCYIKEVKL